MSSAWHWQWALSIFQWAGSDSTKCALSGMVWDLPYPRYSACAIPTVRVVFLHHPHPQSNSSSFHPHRPYVSSQPPPPTRAANSGTTGHVHASRSSNKSTLPSPCSVNDRVLSLPTTGPAAQLQHTPLKNPPLGQTTAPNLSLSTFTLIIPLLGRAKVPSLGKEKEKGVFFVLFLICVDAFALSFRFSILIWFLLEAPDFIPGNTEIAVAPGTEYKDQGTLSFSTSSLHFFRFSVPSFHPPASSLCIDGNISLPFLPERE